MMRIALLIGISLVFVAGCGHPAVDVDAFTDALLSGSTLEEVTEEFGPPHAPSSKQLKKLKDHQRTYNPKYRKKESQLRNAKVWGNDGAFVMAEFNDEGKYSSYNVHRTNSSR